MPKQRAGALKRRLLARRAQALEAEVGELDSILEQLVAETAPALIARPGIGTECASALLVAAGDNPDRLRNEATFAHLCGVAPIDASSGKHERHRLNGDGEGDAERNPLVLAAWPSSPPRQET